MFKLYFSLIPYTQFLYNLFTQTFFTISLPKFHHTFLKLSSSNPPQFIIDIVEIRWRTPNICVLNLSTNNWEDIGARRCSGWRIWLTEVERNQFMQLNTPTVLSLVIRTVLELFDCEDFPANVAKCSFCPKNFLKSVINSAEKDA